MCELICFDKVIIDIIYCRIPADIVDRFATLHLDNLIYSMPFDNSEIAANPTYKIYLEVIDYILVNYPHIFPKLAFGNRLHLSEMCKEEIIVFDYMQYVDPDDAALYLKK